MKECVRPKMLMLLHQQVFTIRHTPPLLDFSDSIALSMQFIEKQDDHYCWVQKCLYEAKGSAVLNVPLEFNPGSEVIKLVLQRLDIG